jgi:hypothetical protein
MQAKLAHLAGAAAVLALASSPVVSAVPNDKIALHPGGVPLAMKVVNCPTGVTLSGKLTPKPGWDGNVMSLPLKLQTTQVVPLNNGQGETLICHYVGKQFDGTPLNGMAYSMGVQHMHCTGTATGFTCSHA